MDAHRLRAALGFLFKPSGRIEAEIGEQLWMHCSTPAPLRMAPAAQKKPAKAVEDSTTAAARQLRPAA